jgi:hypothetical protein
MFVFAETVAASCLVGCHGTEPGFGAGDSEHYSAYAKVCHSSVTKDREPKQVRVN